MPKIFEYFGLVLRFYSNEHEPVHVHAFYQETQTKVDLIIVNRIIVKIEYKKVQGFEMIPDDRIKDLEKLIDTYKYDIVELWVRYFVLKEHITCNKITKKL